ncbi:MAG: Eco57I restriction-modification methylase domain-containing protein [Syntrophaceae bacterium]|nr:Eco57I restriction-modification methylase domain-containing protein [Syntrophaceae bacterium]
MSPERVATDPKKAKLLLRILLIDPQNVYHTDIEVLNNISILPTEQMPEVIWRKHSEAFNVERVTKEFFEAYKSALKFIKEDILLPQKKASYQEVHSFAQQLLSRIMFLYYVQKKGWLKWKDYVQDKRYIKNLWLKYKQSNPKKDTFYSLWLSSLFFHAFNKKHQYLTLNIPDEIKESFNLMPFLNGGLFTDNELDEIGFRVPDEVFQLLFELDPLDKKKGFLERYNFTIRESEPLEVEVAVDPEMLGKVYESLISEEERGKGGIFYTPRIEIDYMCRLSLVEYLSEETKIPKKDLIPLVFEPQRVLDVGAIHELPLNDLRKIKEAIDKVKVVDPAVGSASFLVGMMNVLIEIMRNLSSKIDRREENLFALKNKVLSENLYGVDVKDWAVMVGELRLWLSLIIETEEKFMDIYTKPLLPNLTFKMRQGDSLVEEIAGLQIPLRGKFAYIPKPIKDKITMLVDRKVEYFRGGRSADLKEKDEIEKLQHNLLRNFLLEEIKKIDEKIKTRKGMVEGAPKDQIELIKVKDKEEVTYRGKKEELEAEIKMLCKEKEKLQVALINIGETKGYFLWEIDFAEIFAEKGGFDIVISNPPYVRQEMVAFPLEREEDFDDKEEWREKKREYKEKLAQSIKMHWGEYIKIDKKSDLYVYFYYHGLALLRPGGVFCFINSNSWLDVGYGAGLQEFLLKNMEPVYIIDNLAKRTFAESDVNTVIVLIRRSVGAIHELPLHPLKFIAFKKPFEEVLKPDTLIKIEETQEKLFTDDYRVFPKSKGELLEEGVEMPEEGEEELIKDPMHRPYIGNKWGGKYLRAPEIFFKILEKGKGKLVRLGDIAEVRFGIKTGANDFFYLDDEKIKEWGIEKEFLKPVIKSPRECKRILIKPEDLKYKIFMCHKEKKDLKGTNALEYIKWGEQKKFHERPSCRGRQRWWDVGSHLRPTHIWQKSVNDRHIQGQIPFEAFVDQRLYELE